MEKVRLSNKSLNHTGYYLLEHAQKLLRGKVNNRLPEDQKFYLDDPNYCIFEGVIVKKEVRDEILYIREFLNDND